MAHFMGKQPKEGNNFVKEGCSISDRDWSGSWKYQVQQFSLVMEVEMEGKVHRRF